MPPRQTYVSARRASLKTDMARALHDLGTVAERLSRELTSAAFVASDKEALQYEVEEAFTVAKDLIDVLRWSADDFYDCRPDEILATVRSASEYIPALKVPASA